MSLGASEFSVSCAQNTQKYVENLVKKARKERVSASFLIKDLVRPALADCFSSAPGARKLDQLVRKYAKTRGF